jgi:hypothetical protein
MGAVMASAPESPVRANSIRIPFRTSRLARRLFDADMPPEAIVHYLALQEMCHTPAKATEDFLAPIEQFTNQFAHFGTPRNQDTIRRMQEAIAGFRKVRRS